MFILFTVALAAAHEGRVLGNGLIARNTDDRVVNRGQHGEYNNYRKRKESPPNWFVRFGTVIQSR